MCEPNNFGLKSCAKHRVKGHEVSRRHCVALQRYHVQCQGGAIMAPPPGKRRYFRLSYFWVDEIFLNGRGSKIVCPGTPNLVSKVARYLKEKSHGILWRHRGALRRYRAKRRGGPLWPPSPGKIGLRSHKC